MKLEDLIEKYDKEIFFKIKTKLKHYKKQVDIVSRVSLLTAFGFIFYEHNQFNNETTRIVEESVVSQGTTKTAYEKFIKETNNPFDNKNHEEVKELARLHETEFNENHKNYVMRKYCMGDKEWNFKFFPYLLGGMFGFLLLEDIFAKKKTKLTKNFPRFALTFGGTYALLNLMDYKPISDCNFEEIFNKSLFTYNASLLLTGINYVAYSIFHDFTKKPVIFNYPKCFLNLSKFSITKNKKSLEDAFSCFENGAMLSEFQKSLINLKDDFKFDDVSKTKQKLELILNDDLDLLCSKYDFLSFSFLKDPLKLMLINKNKKSKSQKISNNIENFEFLFSQNNYTAAFNELKNILNNEKYAYDFSVVYTLLYEDFINKIKDDPTSLDLEGVIKFKNSVGDFNKAASQNWNDAIELIFNDSRTQFKDIYGERIKGIISSEYLKKTLAFKKGDFRELESEMRYSEELGFLLQKEKKFSMARPIKIVNLKGDSYYVNAFSNGKDFMTIKNLEQYQDCVDLLKIIHSNLQSKKCIRDYRDDVENRILKYNSNLSVMFKEDSWDYIWNFVTKSCSSVFDCDPHGEQTILSNTKDIVRIDMEDKGMVEWPFQLNKMIIQSGMKGDNYEPLINNYCNGNNIFENIKAYLLATIPSALSYISRTSDDESKREQREIYLGCAIHAAEELGLNDLKKHIKKIKI